MKNRIIFLIVLFVLSFSYCIKGNALEENNKLVCSNSKCYYYVYGVKQTGFQNLDGKIFFFSRVNDNAIKLGWQWIDGYCYYFDEQEGMLTGIHQLDDKYYYFGADGKRESGFKTVDGKTYFFSRINDNAIKLNWQWIDGYCYYFDEQEGMLTGMRQIDGKYYYFGADGKRESGFKTVDGKTYFFSRINDNAMKYGWQYIDGYYYYFTTDGLMLAGNQTIDNYNVELDDSGKLKEGQLTYKGRTYYYKDYIKQVGFQNVEGKIYFFSRVNDNAIKLNWQWIDGYCYYFDEQEGMLTGIHQLDDKYYYFGSDGKRESGFKTVDGKTYFFSRINDNAIKLNWQWIDGYCYYFDEQEGMLTGMRQIDGKYYYFGADGKRESGFKTVDGKTYFFSRINDNAMKYGWQYIDGYYYYFTTDGLMLAGNQTIDNYNVELDDSGKLKEGQLTYKGRTYYYKDYIKQVGFQNVEGKIYFFSRVNDNAIKLNWQWIDGYCYYFDEQEGMLTGMRPIDGKYYYFGADGKRESGFKTIDGKTYFFSRINDNAIKLNWQWIDGYCYYFDKQEGMLTGMRQIDGKYYYFGADGKRESGFKTVEGKTYFFSRINDNAMKYGWQLIDGYFYYLGEDGVMIVDPMNVGDITYTFTSDGRLKLTGWNNINGSRYFFNSAYMVISNTSKLVIDISVHQGNINWEQLLSSGQVYGVIIRLGYLNTNCRKSVDKRLKEYTDAVKKYNIPYGVYWFSYADDASEALIEAQYTKEILSEYNLNPTLGIYYDLEYIIKNPSPMMYQQITRAYIDSMRATYGQYNIKVYASTYFALETIGFNEADSNNYIGWIAQWNDVNTYPYSYDMWQYSSKGIIPGITENYVDLNYYFR